ncbi:MAG: hypothetical protein HW387_142 [Parachlamydiales bacterium]|nr:hypothetical protein [Parachlamydiales bacterium]
MKRFFQRLSRIAFLSVMPLTFLSFIPQPVFSQTAQEPSASVQMNEILQFAADNDMEALQAAFQIIAQTIEDSKDPAATTLSYVEAFVAEANARTGGSLSVPEVLIILREHLDVFQIPPAEQETIIKAIESLENPDLAPANDEWVEAVAGKNHHHHHKIPWKYIAIGVIAVTAMIISPPTAVAVVQGAIVVSMH